MTTSSTPPLSRAGWSALRRAAQRDDGIAHREMRTVNALLRRGLVVRVWIRSRPRYVLTEAGRAFLAAPKEIATVSARS